MPRDSANFAFAPDSTQHGRLPPFEVANAFAFDLVLKQIEKYLEKLVPALLGEEKGSFIAKNLQLKGGGNPTRACVFQTIARCKTTGWYPGKDMGKSTGRKPDISDHQKAEIARVLMESKRKLVKPTPEVTRANTPRLSINPGTQRPISNDTIYAIMHTLCYDEDEDDPWAYMHSPSKDFLSDGVKKSRVDAGEHYSDHVPAGARSSHVAVDPCLSILPTRKAQLDEQKVAAMGTREMMSPKSRLKGPSCRASIAVKSQGKDDANVHWTPVFALGKVHIYVCDPCAAARDPTLPMRLNRSEEFGKFLKHALPANLDTMKREYGWNRVPPTIVHDKASYFVAPKTQRLASTFAAALRSAKMKSWLGSEDDDCSWLAGRLGDVYPYETVISHIRNGLSHRFPRAQPGETRKRFAGHMARVQQFMNLDAFTARDGGGLLSLAEAMRERFRRVVDLKGERLHT